MVLKKMYLITIRNMYLKYSEYSHCKKNTFKYIKNILKQKQQNFTFKK